MGDGHGIEDEPHLSAQTFEVDPSEQAAEQQLRRESLRQTRTDELEHSVWDEPALSDSLAGDQAVSGRGEYAHWLNQRRAQVTPERSWAVTVGAALCAGPWAVVGAVLSTSLGGSAFQFLTVVLFGPVVEEVMKAAVPLYIVEKRPYLFRSRLQLVVCAVGSGLAFAAIENLLYLHVYIPDPSPQLVYWRWTVCVALHVGCAVIYSLGLMRIWHETQAHDTRPRIERAAPYAFTAMALHGSYNALAIALSLAKFTF